VQNNATELRRALDDSAEELLWMAEVMAGNRQTGEQCLHEAIDLAETAGYIGREWIDSWVKRLLVQVVLKRISGEIRQLLPPDRVQGAMMPARTGVSACDRQKFPAIPPQKIIASLNALERACLILHAHLRYSVHDCALLLGCPREWIAPVCERVLVKSIDLDNTTHDGFMDVDPFILAGVTECAG
jgi:hypothetical protein